jgi:hypothetical protein
MKITTITIMTLFLQIAAQSSQDSSFTKAILDRSTSPYFILITVINDSTNSSELITTEAPFLLGAIHIEYSIPYSESGSTEVEKIALSNTSHVFHFKRSASLKNIGMFYNNQILSEVKKKLDALTRDNLLEQIRNPKSELHKIYQGRGKGAYIPYRNAVAHVLLEKGIAVRRNCRSGNLFSE